MKKLILSHFLLLIPYFLFSQNVGIGTTTPQARLDINGDLKLQLGVPVNKFSNDSTFSGNSHTNIPTEKAIKDYLQKGYFAGYDPLAPGSDAPIPKSAQGFGQVYSVDVQGNYAYAVSRSGNVLQTFDISNPDQIVPMGFTTTGLSVPTTVCVKGNYAYVTSAGINSLCVYDISNPSMITFVGSSNTNLSNPQALFVQGNYAYVSTLSPSRLCIFDISNPLSIVAKGFTSTNLASPISVHAQGNLAYVASYNNDRLCVFDISNPDLILPKGFINTNLSQPYCVFAKGNYVYVASSGNNRLCIFDATNPDVLIAKGFTSSNLNTPRSLFVKDDYAYVASFDKISLFKINNPDNIIPAGYNSQYSFGGGPDVIKVLNDYIYAAAYYSERIVIYSLDKEKSIQINSNGIQTTSVHWKTSGNNLYRRSGNVGIGNSNPQAPLSFSNTTGEKVNFYYLSANQKYGVAVQGGKLEVYTATVSDDIVFGYGSTASFTENMRLKGNGSVGIGTNPTLGKLEVRSATIAPQLLLHQSSNSDFSRISFRNDNSTVNARYWDIAGFTDAALIDNDRLNFFCNGQGNILSLNGNGNAVLTGVFTHSSDARLKTDIKPLTNSLQKLLRINGYNYHWINKNSDEGLQTGVMAQEIQKLFPELVKESIEGTLSVNYSGLIPVMIESIKEQQRMLQKQQQQIDELKLMLQQVLER